MIVVFGFMTRGWSQEPRTLTVALESDVKGFDPLQARVMGIATLTVASALYDTLIDLGDEGVIGPRLAESLQESEDGKTWTATLRDDVKFHDGTAFDAEAVAFHFNRLLDPENKCPCRRLIGPIERVEATDSVTVVFHLKYPWAALPAVLAEPSVVSLVGSPTAIGADAKSYHRNPVGTGPYMFAKATPGVSVVLTRNPNYWGNLESNIDRIEFRVLPDQDSRLAAVRAGDVDVASTVDGRSAKRAVHTGGVEVTRYEGAGARMLILNSRKPPLDDRRVRQALAHALDMALIVSSSSADEVAAATDPFGPAADISCQAVANRAYDPRRARELLAEHQGPVSLTFLHTATPRGREMGQIVQQYWGEIGVDVTLEPVAQAELLQRVLKRDFEVSAWRFRDSRDPDPDVFGLLHTRSPLNVTGYGGVETDALIMKGRTSSDHSVRQQAYCALARRLSVDVPLILTSRNTYFALTAARVHGRPVLRGGFLNVRGLRLGE